MVWLAKPAYPATQSLQGTHSYISTYINGIISEDLLCDLDNLKLYKLIRLGYEICQHPKSDLLEEEVKRLCRDVKRKLRMIAWLERIAEIAG